jgi:HAD superfamily hydrolase (TIGR01484 family)
MSKIKVLAFDVDDTLNVSKMPISDEIADLLTELLNYYEICPISGQKFEQFLLQIVNQLTDATPQQLQHLHLFAAQGTQYYKFTDNDWKLVYSYPLTDEQITKITQSLEQASKELGYWEENPTGEIIENRLSQITLSALGQEAKPEAKYAWDPEHKKRTAIIKRAQELAPEFGYEIGGTTSINVFVPGMNKSFGMTKMMEYLNVDKAEILYFGDMTQPGGNDYPVVEMGIKTITVRDLKETANILRGILAVSEKEEK